MFFLFAGALQSKRIGAIGLAFHHAGDDVRTAEPVRFSQIGPRPLRRAIGMRVVKADDVETAGASTALRPNQLFWRDVEAVAGAVAARVAAGHSGCHGALVALHLAQQHSAAFVRISLLAVAANGFKIALRHFQHMGRCASFVSDSFLPCMASRISSLAAKSVALVTSVPLLWL